MESALLGALRRGEPSSKQHFAKKFFFASNFKELKSLVASRHPAPCAAIMGALAKAYEGAYLSYGIGTNRDQEDRLDVSDYYTFGGFYIAAEGALRAQSPLQQLGHNLISTYEHLHNMEVLLQTRIYNPYAEIYRSATHWPWGTPLPKLGVLLEGRREDVLRAATAHHNYYGTAAVYDMESRGVEVRSLPDFNSAGSWLVTKAATGYDITSIFKNTLLEESEELPVSAGNWLKGSVDFLECFRIDEQQNNEPTAASNV